MRTPFLRAKIRSIFNVKLFNAAVSLQGAFSSLFNTVFRVFVVKKKQGSNCYSYCNFCEKLVTIRTNKNGGGSLVTSRVTARRQTKERLKRIK